MDNRQLFKCVGLWGGRGLFPAALIAHCSLLVQYLVQYEEQQNYYCFYLVLLPVLLSWFFVLRLPNEDNSRFRWLWLLLLVFMWCFLAPMVGSVFRMVVIEDKLLSSKFFSPNFLKNILCITPFQLLFMLVELQVPTAKKPGEYMYLVSTLSYTLVLDLFDGIGMLVILVDESNMSQQIPKDLKIAILAAACGFFLLSPLELLQLKFSETGDGANEVKPHKRVFYIRSALQFLVNILFLVLRLVLWLGYGRDAAIFMAKNVLSFMLLAREIEVPVMGRRILWFGRFFFFALLATQCALLAQYPVTYGEDDAFCWLAAIYALVPIVWAVVYCCCSGRDQVRWLWLVWLSYSVVLVVMVGVIFGRIVIEHKLDKDNVYGPNTLKTTLCIAPAEMLLLLNTATDIPEYYKVLVQLSVTATVDLFDGIEMLEVIIEESQAEPNATSRGLKEVNATCKELKEHDPISERMKKTILGFVCVFFLISFLELLQFKFKEYPIKKAKVRKTVFCIHNVFQLLLNTSFLVLRILLWIDHDREAAIFITKNVISLVLIVVRVLFECGVV